MVKRVEPSAQNMSELLEVAAILVCKGYALSTRKALYLACKEVYGYDEYSDNTYQLFQGALTVVGVTGLMADGALVFRGGYTGPSWLDEKSRELLLMSLIWAKTYVDAEMVPARDDVQQNVTQHYE